MKHIIQMIILSGFLAANVALAGEPDTPNASSANNANASATSKTDVPDAANPRDNVADEKDATEESKEKSAENENATFVDKDGDGINDGKEHRFRKKSMKSQRKDNRRLLRRGKNAGKAKAGRNIHNR